MSTISRDSSRIAIVGGGLAGLTAAAYLARDGHRVQVYEKSRAVGGRARTRSVDGFRFNLGPHALYSDGAARHILDDLGVPWSGHRTGGGGALALVGDRAAGLPIGFVSLLATSLLSLGGKLEAGRFLASLPHLDAESLGERTVAQWLDERVRHPEVRALVEALVRLSTYTHAPDRIGATRAIRQIQMASRGGVYYVDGGWQTLVNGLRRAALEAGVRIGTGARVDSLAELDADAVIIAADPTAATELSGRDLGPFEPVRVACLDVALSELPRPRVWFALGIDAPLYLSVHTRFADLASEGGAVIHVARYLAPGERDVDRAQLESALDRAQPGWRERLVHSRFVPGLTVSHALPVPGPRPAVAVGDGVFVAGDWVGEDGLLADAAMASARRAAAAASAWVRDREAAAA